MNLVFQLSLNSFLAAGYVFCYIALNCTAYLISAFYKKKFNHSLMNTGFLASIVFCSLALPTMFLSNNQFTHTTRFILLIAGVILSSWNAVLLYGTMRKVRK